MRVFKIKRFLGPKDIDDIDGNDYVEVDFSVLDNDYSPQSKAQFTSIGFFYSDNHYYIDLDYDFVETISAPSVDDGKMIDHRNPMFDTKVKIKSLLRDRKLKNILDESI